MSKFLHGVHDEGADHLHADKPGWTVITEAIGSDPNDKSGRDYSYLVDRGFTPIVRLNNAHNGRDGTIPLHAHYGSFAKRCANFVGASPGCNFVIIGNEPNHLQERPNGQAITPTMYADCFNFCNAAIKVIAPNVQIITAPVAPWDDSTKYPTNPNGDWIVYFADMLKAIQQCDGIGGHTYTHGAGIHLITSSARMQPPFQHRRYEFRAYLDFLEAVPENKQALPFYITETDQVDPWVDANTQWVQAAYAEINNHNLTPGTQKIKCLCLYRWKGDKWEFTSKSGVQSDFRAAVAMGYQSPQIDAQNYSDHSETVLMPVILNESPSVPALPPRQISDDFKRRVPDFTAYDDVPGRKVYRLIKAEYVPDGARRFGPDHHILVDVLDAQGKRQMGTPVNFYWGSGMKIVEVNKVGEPYGADYGMTSAGHGFGVWVGNFRQSSDDVFGMGLGKIGSEHMGEHVTYFLVFQEVVLPAATTPTPQPTGPHAIVTAPAGANIRTGPDTNYSIRGAEPVGTVLPIIGRNGDWWQVDMPHAMGWVSNTVVLSYNVDTVPVVDVEPVTPPAPQPPQPTDNWARCIAFVRRWEGGWADDPNDPGGATNKGITLGTYTRWREAHGQPAPTKDDLRRISDAEVDEIYRRWYWQASGADRLPWPLALAQFDTAVNAGVGKAQEMLQRSNGDFLAYMSHLIDWYTRIPNFEHFGRAWIRRRADILLEAAKP